MNPPVPEFKERMLVQHLLGQLPEADQERLDALAVTDDTVAARLCDVENDLVDTYVRGELAGDDLEHFKDHYLTSARRRRKVLFAESLLSLERRPSNVTVMPTPVHMAPARFQRLAWVAVIVLSVVASAVVLDDRKFRRYLADSRAQIDTLSSRLSQRDTDLKAAKSDIDSLELQMQRLKDPVADLNETGSNGKAVLIRVASFFLTAPTRGLNAPPSFNLAADVNQVAVRISLEDAEFAQYRVSLFSRSHDRALWRSQNLAPVQTKRGPVLNLTVPAERLKGGSYRFDIAEVSSGHAEVVASYPFNVDREN